MKLLHLIFRVLVNTYFSSADPNMFDPFGAKKREKQKSIIAGEYKKMAQGTEDEINQLKSENPFESAGAKAAMEKASRGAKQMQTRMLNTMGNNASPEALVASQGATNEALGSAAGEIATVAEANKNNKISNLKGLQTQQMGMYGGMGNSAAGEIGSGWNTLFQGIDTFGKIASGGGQAAGSVTTAGA